MTQRITKEMVQGKLRALEAYTGLYFKISRWSPGDGVTRYTVFETDQERKHDFIQVGSAVLGIGNLYDMLRAMVGLLEVLEAHGQQRASPPVAVTQQNATS